MDSPDPYYTVQDDVIKNIGVAKNLYNDWKNLSLVDNDATRKIADSLRQVLRTTELDLEDLQESVNIAEQNPSRFQLSSSDVDARHCFLREVRGVIRAVKTEIAKGSNPYPNRRPINFNIAPAIHRSDFEIVNEQANDDRTSTRLVGLPHTLPVKLHQGATNYAYSNSRLGDDPLTMQKQILRHQDERLDQLGTSITTLKDISHQIGSEIGDQIVLLDDFNNEMTQAGSKIDTITKRTARLLHLSTDRRQWCAIFALSITLFITLILLVVL